MESKDDLEDRQSLHREGESSPQSNAFPSGKFHSRITTGAYLMYSPLAVSSPLSPSDHDATPRGEYPPHHTLMTSSSRLSSPPRHPLTRQKTVKQSEPTGSNVLASFSNQSFGVPSTSSRSLNYPLDALDTSDISGQPPLQGVMTSVGTKGPQSTAVDDEGFALDNNWNGRINNSERASSPSHEGNSMGGAEPTAFGLHSALPDSQFTSNTWSESTKSDTDTERRSSFTARPWLGSRTSSSTIDIPIESIAYMEDEDPIGAREERASSTNSYFPDVEDLKRTGMMREEERKTTPVETAKASVDSREQRTRVPPPQSESPSASRPREETAGKASDSPRNTPAAPTGSWPCSKKHGDTPLGMSTVMALANSLCLDQSRMDKSSLKRVHSSNQKPLIGSVYDDTISPKSQLPPVLVPGKQDTRHPQIRRAVPSFEGQSSPGLSPMGKQASLTASTSRSSEDSLLESWGFTVSTPLHPPKCYPLPSPSVASAPRERFCRQASSHSSLSASASSMKPSSAPSGLDGRRRFSSSTPPALDKAGRRSASMTASLDSRPPLSSAHGFGGDESKRTITASPMMESSNYQSSRPSPLRLGSGHDSDYSSSDVGPSRPNTRSSVRQNSGTSSDQLSTTDDWRRDSGTSAQSYDTRASQSSAIFSLEDRDRDEQLLSPSVDSEQTFEGYAADLERQDSGEVGDQTQGNPAEPDEPHIVAYEGVVNIIPYEDRYVISAIMEGFTVDNITVAVKSVRSGIREGILDDTASAKSAGSSVSSQSSFTAGNKTRKTKCVHLVADRWEDGGKFCCFLIGKGGLADPYVWFFL